MIYSKYIISDGDTLQSISQSVLGDANKWYDIATYNNLVYPYISDVLSDNVVNVGDTIIIPITNDENYNMSADSLSDVQKNNLSSFVLGKDLSLIDDTSAIESRGTTDEIITLESSGKTLSTVSGYDNLVQALLVRLNTPIGTLLLHPEYGNNFSDILGQSNTLSNINKLKVGIEQTLRKDSRVSDVKIISTDIEDGTVKINVSITPIGLDEQLQLYLGANNDGIVALG